MGRRGIGGRKAEQSAFSSFMAGFVEYKRRTLRLYGNSYLKINTY